MKPTPATPAAFADRRNSVGFLRLLLAAVVLYSHAYFLGGFGRDHFSIFSRDAVSAGTLAVQCFFVLSGALIATSWNRRHSLGRFLWHRFLRLAPALWVCLAVTAFVFTPVLHFHTPPPRTHFFELDPSAWDYVWRNLIFPRTKIAIPPYPNLTHWGGDWNGSLWTLFYEGFCYVVVAGLGLLGLLNRFRVAGGVVIVGFIALCTFWTVCSPTPPGWLPTITGRLFATPGKQLTVLFLAGSAWAIFPEVSQALLRRRWVGPLACGLIVATWQLGLHAALGPWLLPPALFWTAQALPFANFERWAGGDYSYGVYVYGYPIQQILAHFQLHTYGIVTYLAASFVLTGLCAFASWRLVERPALALKDLFHRTARPPAPV